MKLIKHLFNTHIWKSGPASPRWKGIYKLKGNLRDIFWQSFWRRIWFLTSCSRQSGFWKAMEALSPQRRIYLNHCFSPTGHGLHRCLWVAYSQGSPDKWSCLGKSIKRGWGRQWEESRPHAWSTLLHALSCYVCCPAFLCIFQGPDQMSVSHWSLNW